MLSGEIVGDRFEVERLAGSGGMGTVYRARDRLGGAPVALKVLREHGAVEIERFTREAEVLADLSHPAIVRFIAHGATAGGEPWLALEWLDGENLGDRLRRDGLTVAESLTLGARVAEALGAAHRRGVVHRDIKPTNLLLAGGRVDDVRILDFGIARRGPGDRALTQTGAMIGTPGYIAPEQARGERVDARADVFSLGCVLFRCLTGRRPFEADDVMAMLLKLVLEDAPRLRALRPDAPEALEALLAAMLSKTRTDRPADGAEVAAAIAAIGRPEGGRAPRGSLAPPALTTTERPVMCVVLARMPLSFQTSLTGDATVAMPDARRRNLGAALDAHGASVAVLADRTLLVTVPSAGAFTDQAARAARSALVVREMYPDARIALAAGRAEVSARAPMGEVIERGVDLLRRAPEGAARLDEVMAGLCSASFEIGGDGDGLVLVREREAEGKRTLLGRPTPFVGRERELLTLEAIFEEVAVEGVARAVIVTAPSGAGKSRLRLELVRKLRERALGPARDDRDAPREGGPLASEPPPGRSFGFEVWLGRGDPMRAGSPFGLLAPAIRRLAGVRDGEPATVRRKKLRARVARHVAGADEVRIAVFLGELAGVPFPDDESVELAAARHDAMLMGDQMRRAFEDFVAAECAAEPRILVLEDVHWGDRPSLRFVDGALRNLAEKPLLVIAVGRPEVGDLFPQLWTGRPVTELKLSSLGKRASEKLVRQVLGDADAKVVDRIVALAGADAFFLEELIRATAEGKGDALPETVLGMVQQRLDGLDPERRRALRAASVFGRVFWSGGVTALLGADKTPRVTELLDDLVERELLLRQPAAKFPGQDEYAFRQSLVREAAYGMLTDKDRRLGHRLAGAFLEAAGESEPGLLAEHFERGGEPAHAVAWYRGAAAQALEGNELQAAIDWADRALRCAKDPADPALRETLGAVRLIQAEAHRWRDEFALAEQHGAEATELLVRGSTAWFTALGEVAIAAGRSGHVQRLIAAGETLRDLWSPDGPATQLFATAWAAPFLVYAGAVALADDLLAKVEAVEPAVRDPRVKGRIHQSLAIRALVQGDPGGHLRRIEAAAQCFAEAGDLRNACMARITLGFAQTDTAGAHDAAERALREALATAERMGLPGPAAYARHTLGLALARQGSLVEARDVEAIAVASFEAKGDARLTGGSRAYLAMILAAMGDLDAALAEATAAIEGLQGAPAVRAYAFATRSRIQLAAGRSGDALADARAAVALMHELGGIEEGEALVRLAHAEALAASGDRGAARVAIEEAVARLRERAGKLGDAFAARFLEGIPENARTFALEAELRAS